MIHDLRYSVRTLRRSPAFTAAAVATLTLAIAANTTMLSVIDQVLLRPLPFSDAGRLYMVVETDGRKNYRAASYLTFLDWQQQSRTFSGLAFLRGRSGLMRTADGEERIAYAAVTPGYFSMLGVHPIIGRTFLPDEENGAGDDVAVLSYELWQSQFGGDRAVVGRTIDFDSTVIRIIGVMPPGATWPDWASFWRPLAGKLAADPALANRNFHVDSRVIGRLRADVPLETARSEFGVIQTRLAATYPGESAGWIAGEFDPLRRNIIGDVSAMLWLLGGGVIVVLLIACANVSSLSLVRAITREREMAIRKALGATSGRLSRQLLTESVLVALVAGAAGLLISVWAIRAIHAAASHDLPRVSELRIDWRVFGVALGLSLLAALLVGARPLVRLRSAGFADPLRQGRHGGMGARAARARNALSVVQLGLAITLLLCGGLLVRSMRRIQQVEVGFDARDVLGFQLSVPPGKYARAADAAALYQRVLEVIRAVPGVVFVAAINHPPAGGAGAPTRVLVPDRPADIRSADVALYRTISADYFRTVRIPLLRGRVFSEADMKTPGDGIVISESVARRYWAGRDPVGEPVTIFGSSQFRPDYGQPQPSHVIGVVGDVSTVDAAGPEPTAEIYVPFTRTTWPGTWLVVRTAGAPSSLIPALKRAILTVDPAIPVAGSAAGGGFTPLGRGFSQALAVRRYAMRILGGFAASALLLALVGVYGVIAYGVTQRTQEFGVRLALGAAPTDIFSMILKQGLWLALFGVVAGVSGGFALTRLLTKLLYNTSPTDAATFGVVSAAVVGTVMVASAIPALRAARLDPTVALRDE
jgi:putative ABC transport system permease protein